MKKVSQKELEKLGKEEGFDLETFETEMSEYDDEPEDNKSERSEFATQVDQSIATLREQAKRDPTARQIFEKVPDANMFISEDPDIEYDALRAKGHTDAQIRTFMKEAPVREFTSGFLN